MIEPIMFFGLGFLVASLLGLIIVPLVHGARGAPDRAPARGRDAAVDGGDPGRQGSVARRIRDVDAAARNERRAAEGQDHQPARRARQEERRHQPAQDRARREGRDASSRSKRATRASRISCARPRTSSRSRPARCARPSAISPTRKPSSPSATAQLSETDRDLRQPARRDRRAQDAGRQSQGPGRRPRHGGQGHRGTLRAREGSARESRQGTRRGARQRAEPRHPHRRSSSASSRRRPPKPRSWAAASPTWRRG